MHMRILVSSTDVLSHSLPRQIVWSRISYAVYGRFDVWISPLPPPKTGHIPVQEQLWYSFMMLWDDYIHRISENSVEMTLKPNWSSSALKVAIYGKTPRSLIQFELRSHQNARELLFWSFNWLLSVGLSGYHSSWQIGTVTTRSF
jgi:hypothetical protein